jgi:hypothetical protein
VEVPLASDLKNERFWSKVTDGHRHRHLSCPYGVFSRAPACTELLIPRRRKRNPLRTIERRSASAFSCPKAAGRLSANSAIGIRR